MRSTLPAWRCDDLVYALTASRVDHLHPRIFKAMATVLAPLSWPSRPGFAMRTRIMNLLSFLNEQGTALLHHLIDLLKAFYRTTDSVCSPKTSRSVSQISPTEAYS